jgi:hypothetical protein
MVKSVIKCFCPYQYLKNGFFLLGPLFALKSDLVKLAHPLFASLSYYTLAGVICLLNPVIDIKKVHPHRISGKRLSISGVISLRVIKNPPRLLTAKHSFYPYHSAVINEPRAPNIQFKWDRQCFTQKYWPFWTPCCEY